MNLIPPQKWKCSWNCRDADVENRHVDTWGEGEGWGAVGD